MEIEERLAKLKDRIRAACRRAGRDACEIRILAASKTRNVAEILAAVRAGIDLIGENTVQEARAKFEFLPLNLEKHFIGTLQPNKARQAVRLFDLVQSVNGLELAQRLDREAAKLGRRYPVLIEVNPAGEISKRGVRLEEAHRLADRLLRLEHLRLEGLMAMMPYAEDPETVRPYFRQMKELFEELRRHTGLDLEILSMGMSGDFEVALEEGATMIRLGSSIFGPRAPG